jgi:hypothetical protein
MRSTGRIWAQWLFLTLFVAGAAPAHAEGGAGAGVEVTLVGSVAEIGDLRRLLSEWDAALEIRLSNQLNAGDILNGPAAKGQLRIWVVLSSPEIAIIYFKDPSGERFLVREVPLSAGLDESGRETLAQVISTSARAFVDKQVGSSALEVAASFRKRGTAVQPDASSDQARTSPAAGTTGARLRISGLVAPIEVRKHATKPVEWRPHFGAFYAASLVRPGDVGHGPGASVGAARRSESSRWYLAVQAQYRFPLSIEDERVRLTLRTVALSAVTAWERPIVGAWFLGLGLGLGVELTKQHATATAGSGVAARSDEVGYRPMAVPCLRVGSDLGPLRLAASLGVQVSPMQTRYVVDGSTIYTPWMVEPRSAIELYW